MKISINWIKEFTDIKLSTDELVKKIGAQLGEVEQVVDLGERYENIVVAKVVSCDKHPNADKLNVCLVDDGKKTKDVKRDSNGFVQVVCGAPNIRKGLTIAWIPPGVVVPSTFDKEPLKLDVRPLRGIDSNGMIASPKELAVSDDHYGVLVIDKPARPGQMFSDVYELDDTIIDIENKMFTHRPDCFGILGVAREIAGIQNIRFKSPKWYQKSLELKAESSEKLPLTVTNKLPDLVPRFMAQTISGVSVKPSPIIMQSFLTRVGLKPINNVVDITNFVMMLTAQPLHAYDYDKVASKDGSKTASLIIRKPKPGEKITLLNGKTISPTKDAIMIATKKALIGVGGVMGGKDTEVDGSTTNIIMECASFDMYSIRRTSMEHGLFTDAVTRFNKGQSTIQNDRAIRYANAMVEKLAGGSIAGSEIDNRAKPKRSRKVAVTTGFINTRLGLDLTTSEITKLLTNVEFDVERDKTKILISPPFWRTDVEIPEDIVEEVGRLYGYDHLPLALPTRSLQPVKLDQLLQTKASIRDVLSSAGANELLNYSFVHGDLIKNSGQNTKEAYSLSNALSPDLQYYRLSLTPSLLEKINPNIKAGFDKFAIYEINKTHSKEHISKKDKLPKELESVALVWASKNKSDGAPYFQAKKYLDVLCNKLGITIDYSPAVKRSSNAVDGPFEPKRSAHVVDRATKDVIGIVGEYSRSVARALKLPEACAGFEIYSEKLIKPYTDSYKPLSRFPSTEQDISFKLPADKTYAQLFETVETALQSAQVEHGYNYQIDPIDIYQGKNDKAHFHIAFRITVSHYDRTLVREEINKLLDEVSIAAHQKIKASRI